MIGAGASTPARLRTVIIDANYFRSLREPELDALRVRGFSLRVSLSAFIEVWANAVENADPGRIYAPARRLAPYVSKDWPIAPSGGSLIRAVGGRIPPNKATPFLGDASEFFRNARRVWTDLITEQGHTEWWERSGRLIASHVKDRADHWIDLARNWRERRPEHSEAKHEDTLRKIEQVGHDAIRRAVFPYVVRSHGDPQLRNPALRDRMNAYLRVMALRLFETGRGAETATPNDAEDLIQLQHLGTPAFLMTADADIHFDVSRAGTFQAPWVRRLVEMLEDDLPEGSPWGATAIAQAARFGPRSKQGLKELAARELQAVKELRE
ncbi:MAG: hypothetical protein KF850_34465 [Labilithrix sp.]|nr:hypothetical protein [Labilithrix sp.]MBX3217185.1 hypothetical protein [Labilithrix sp.]